MGIEDNPYLAWMFDNAVSTFGRWVQAKLDERDKEGRPENRIEDLLDIPLVPKKFPMASLDLQGRRVKPPVKRIAD